VASQTLPLPLSLPIPPPPPAAAEADGPGALQSNPFVGWVKREERWAEFPEELERFREENPWSRPHPPSLLSPPPLPVDISKSQLDHARCPSNTPSAGARPHRWCWCPYCSPTLSTPRSRDLPLNAVTWSRDLQVQPRGVRRLGLHAPGAPKGEGVPGLPRGGARRAALKGGQARHPVGLPRGKGAPAAGCRRRGCRRLRGTPAPLPGAFAVCL
jgi:hypothetical protein